MLYVDDGQGGYQPLANIDFGFGSLACVALADIHVLGCSLVVGIFRLSCAWNIDANGDIVNYNCSLKTVN